MSDLSYTASGHEKHPTLLFLHGFLGSSKDWREVIVSFDESFRCIAVDLPGHGKSLGMPAENRAMEGAANELLKVLDGLGIERASIVGYSMGGRLALYFALRFPERCEKLFLESASPGLKTEKERAARREADEERAKRLEGGNFEEFLRDWHRQPLFTSLSRHEGLVEKLIERRKDNVPRELAKSLRGMGTGSQPSLWEKLKDLPVPTLAVAGGLDEKFVCIAREMAERSPRISPEIVPNAGHNVRLEAPGAYLSLSERFISRFFAGG
ncbi:MAG: 2-succinyl-6-hydroxy-2,4-cyclohexadiene-1-carboxylate synthase [Rubrobacteraceae bacterium]